MNNISLPSSRDLLLQMAESDFNPELAAIDEQRIANLDWPLKDLAPMVIGLHDRFRDHDGGAFSFLLLMTSINYRFWRLNAGALDRYQYGGKTGARALWLAFETIWGDGPTSNEFRGRVAEEGISGTFGDIPDARSRAVILDEILKGDIDRIGAELADQARTSGTMTVADAARLGGLYPEAFAEPYLKKAQLGLSLCAGFLRSQGHAIDTNDFTAFADYQVPRVLRALGILHYGEALAHKVDSRVLIAAGSDEERAIRAASVVACERIGVHLNVPAAEIDNLLWNCQQVAGDTPFHLTLTTWY